MPPPKVNLTEKFTLFDDHWSPKVVGSVDDYEIKLVKVEGRYRGPRNLSAREISLRKGGRDRLARGRGARLTASAAGASTDTQAEPGGSAIKRAVTVAKQDP